MLNILLLIEYQEPLSSHEIGEAIRYLFYIAFFIGAIKFLNGVTEQKKEETLKRKKKEELRKKKTKEKEEKALDKLISEEMIFIKWKEKKESLELSIENEKNTLKILEGYIKDLEQTLGKPPSFNEFIDYFIQKLSNIKIKKTEEIYSYLVTCWESNNNQRVDYDFVYNNTFIKAALFKDIKLEKNNTTNKAVNTATKIDEPQANLTDFNTNLWLEVEERFKYNYPVQVYIIDTKEEYYSVNIIVPDYGVPISDYKNFSGKTGILPIKSLFQNIRETKNDEIQSYIGKLINTRIVFIDKKLDQVILEPLVKV